MIPTITAFERSPDGGKGLARDTRVRWALEEVGQPYKVRLVSFKAMKEPAPVSYTHLDVYKRQVCALWGRRLVRWRAYSSRRHPAGRPWLRGR